MSHLLFRTQWLAVAWLAGQIACGAEPLSSVPATPSPAQSGFESFEVFASTLSPLVRAQRPMTSKHYRQIEPSLYYFAVSQAECFAALALDGQKQEQTHAQQVALLVKLCDFLDRKRKATANATVIERGRSMIGLLDPARGLERKEITTLAAAYDAPATVFKQDARGESIRSVADAFLSAVKDAATQQAPTTIVVLGHGSPEEIQSYSIPFERLADAMLGGAIGGPSEKGSTEPVDLSHLVLICDDCFSADFLINLGNAIETRCRDRSRPLVSLPYCIAGTNRGRVGHADFGEKFVPHFWKDVIELFYVRQPRPKQVVLGDFFGKVDNMMYGYGRTPIVKGSEVVGYRTVDPELFQDPVIFVPLDEKDLATLRAILDLKADAPLPRLLDIG